MSEPVSRGFGIVVGVGDVGGNGDGDGGDGGGSELGGGNGLGVVGPMAISTIQGGSAFSSIFQSS